MSFASSLVLMRLLEPSDFGKFALISAYVGVAGTLVNFKTPDVVLQASQEDIETGLLGRVGAAICLETVLVGVSGAAALYVLDLLLFEAWIVLGTTLVTTWLNTEIRFFERDFAYRPIALLEMTAHVTAHGLAVLGAMGGLGAIVLYLRGALRAGCIAAGLWRLDALGSFPVRWLRRAEWESMLRRVRGFWSDSVIQGLFQRALIVVAGAIGTDTVTGLIFQARRLAMIPNQLLAPVLDRLMLNYLSMKTQKERRARLRDLLLGFVAMLSPVVVGIWQFGDPVIPFVFGSDWRPVVPILLFMGGVVVGAPALNAIKVYCMAGNNMGRFLLAGRGGQYVGFLSGIVLLYTTEISVGNGLSLALTLAFGLGTILGWTFVE